MELVRSIAVSLSGKPPAAITAVFVSLLDWDRGWRQPRRDTCQLPIMKTGYSRSRRTDGDHNRNWLRRPVMCLLWCGEVDYRAGDGWENDFPSRSRGRAELTWTDLYENGMLLREIRGQLSVTRWNYRPVGCQVVGEGSRTECQSIGRVAWQVLGT